MADAALVKEALRQIFSGIELLRTASKGTRKFTIDGRLVGDIGEVIAARDYDIVLDEKQRTGSDARMPDGRDVQIKATFKDSLTFRTETAFYLGLKFEADGTYKEVFNGPGSVAASAFSHRKGFGKDLLSASVAKLEALSRSVADDQRISRRPSEIRRD
jgi:hypothetical protein